MKQYFCPQHDAVASAIRAGNWPDGCDPALRAHVESCASCGDLALVAQTMRQVHAETTMAARLPAPGIVWWRAQVRRRNAALASVMRPVAVAEKIAVVVLLVAVIALGVWQHAQVTEWLSNIFGPLSGVTQLPWLLLALVGTLVICGVFAVYLFTAKE